MSEIFDALLKAQRDVQREAKAKEAPVGGREVGPSEPQREPRRTPSRQRRTARSRWPHWLARNGKRPSPEISPELLISPEGDGQMAEPFRVLRSTLLGLGSGMFMITSPLDGEGKTLSAANLAISLALPSTRDVILVDLDLRRPSLDSRLGVKPALGTIDCLQGKAKWQDCLSPTAYPHLRFLPAGTATKHAPELLASDGLRAMLEDLRVLAQSHFVIVDTPPILLASDPLLLANQMDHVLLMVRAGTTPRSALLKAVEAIGTDKLLGVVFNEATVQPSDYYRYGKHHLYYGYNSGTEPIA